MSLVVNRLEGGIELFNLRENLVLNDLREFFSHGILRARDERRAAASLIQQFWIHPAESETAFGALSGGNQQKVILAKPMRLAPKVLLLDDPTQGVDVGARAAVHQILRDAIAGGLAVLISSTDFEELCMLCQRVIILKDGRINGDFNSAELTPANILSHCYRGIASPDPL